MLLIKLFSYFGYLEGSKALIEKGIHCLILTYFTEVNTCISHSLQLCKLIGVEHVHLLLELCLF